MLIKRQSKMILNLLMNFLIKIGLESIILLIYHIKVKAQEDPLDMLQKISSITENKAHLYYSFFILYLS